MELLFLFSHIHVAEVLSDEKLMFMCYCTKLMLAYVLLLTVV